MPHQYILRKLRIVSSFLLLLVRLDKLAMQQEQTKKHNPLTIIPNLYQSSIQFNIPFKPHTPHLHIQLPIMHVLVRDQGRIAHRSRHKQRFVPAILTDFALDFWPEVADETLYGLSGWCVVRLGSSP